MASEDQIKWDAKYRAGEYETRTHASAFVAQHLSPIAGTDKRALDIACGRGRNSRFLAGLGYQVDALDISPVGLELAKGIDPEGIDYQQCDVLEAGLGQRGPYDVVIMIRFVALNLLNEIGQYLVPGGTLLVENHLQVDDMNGVGGPRSERFRVAPGELRANVADELTVTSDFEGLIQDPDGLTMAVAQILAIKQ